MRQIDATYPPNVVAVTRDPNGDVATFTVGTRPEWVITRDVDGSVLYVENGQFRRTVLRGLDGRVIGVSVVALL